MHKLSLLASVALVATTAASLSAELKPIRKAPAVAAAPAWAGFYAGPTLGWATGRSDGFYQGTTPQPTPPAPPIAPLTCNQGPLLADFGPANPLAQAISYVFCALTDPIAPGAVAGYNVQFGDVVAGAELDLGWIGASGRTWAPDGSLRYDDIRVTWYGHARGRVGYAFGRYLPYIAGGAALAGFEPSHFRSDATGSVLYATHDTRVGWTLGVGLEVGEIFPGVTVRGEYLYDHFAPKQYDWVPGMRYSIMDLKLHTLRAAATWRFAPMP